MLNRRFKSRVVSMLVLPCVSLFAWGQELGDIETIINEDDSSFLIPVLQAGTDFYRVQLDYEDPYWSVAEVTPVSNASVNSGSYANAVLSLSCVRFQGQHYTVTMGLVDGTDPLLLELLSYSVTDCNSPPCDIKLENAQIYTFDILATQATTLTIRGNTIEAIGTAAAAQSCTETIDAAGRVVIPGLNDNHVHYFNRINAGGHVVAEMDTARSQADVIRILQEAIAIQNVPAVSGAVTVRNFLVTEGGNHQAALIEGSWPNLAALNAVDRPVFLIEGRDNAGWVNQAAKDFFDVAGVGNVASNGQVLDPVGAKNHLLNLESDADRQEDWLDGNRWAASVGMTAMQNFSGDPLNDYPEIVELYTEGVAFLRFHYGVRSSSDFLSTPASPNPDMIRVTSIGEFHQGSSFSGPSANYISDAQEMANAGLTTHQHAINSGSDVEAYIDLWEDADAQFGINGLRWRLDHVFDITHSQMTRLNIIGSNIAIQGIGSATGNASVQDLREVYDFSVSNGLNLSAGTDGGNFYIINPWVAMHFFITGESETGSQLMPASNTVNLYEAIHMYTIGSAYDTFDEGKIGSLEVGKFADLAVLAVDPFEIESLGNLDELRDVTSVLTIVDGDIVYSNGLINCNGSAEQWYRRSAGDSCVITDN